MRIIGGKDYYDHGLAWGIDPEIVFLRTGSTVSSSDFGIELFEAGPEISLREGGSWIGRYYRVSAGKTWVCKNVKYQILNCRVIFCGKLYGGVKINVWEKAFYKWGSDYPAEPTRTEFFWERNNLSKFLAKAGAEIKVARKDKKEAPRKAFCRRDCTTSERSFLVQNRIAVATQIEGDVVRFLAGGVQKERPAWQVNSDTLKETGFFKVIDPTTAFQELSMWVGGVLPRNPNPMIEITDDRVKLAKHGMDATSFRKPPQKKR